MHALLATLNPAQCEAAQHTNGPLLIIAGAGSGKTRVITTRIALLLQEHKIPASQIIALTFTNKAALEMKERIAALIGEGHRMPFIGTFHSYCVRLLKQFAALRATPFGGILDADDQHKIVKAILQKHGLQKQLNATSVAYQISQIKNRSHDRHRYLKEHTNKLFTEVYYAYEAEKKQMHCLDFDDLLIETVALFDDASFTKEIHKTVRHVLIDEYQDTNGIQHELLKKLCLTRNKLRVDSICAVGDEDQSIYSWRGATVANMRNFTHDFPVSKIIKIEQNYRSAQQILEVANTAISHNTQRTPKKLWSEKKGANRVCMITFGSEYQEADALALVAELALEQRTHKQSCAFLYRMHAQSRTIEEALVQKSIPYRIIGGTQFYERMEVRDLLAYLKLISNPFDRISAARILNTPTRGLGAKAGEEFFATWDQYPNLPFLDIVHMMAKQQTGVKAQALKTLHALFASLDKFMSPSDALRLILQKTQYIAYLTASYEKEEAAERSANVEELLNAAIHGEQNDMRTISTFLESVALMQEFLAPREETTACVLLMTLHAAKGLEFDTVVVCGLEEGILPTSRALYDSEMLEEERRLLYVGITRARERLLFTQARTRLIFGKLTPQMSSRFIKELPSAQVAMHDATKWRMPMLNNCLAQWLGCTTPHTAPQDFVTPPTIKPTAAAKFRVAQSVKHARFGIGIVKEIEERSTQTIVTTQFRTGTKKIVSDFLTPL